MATGVECRANSPISSEKIPNQYERAFKCPRGGMPKMLHEPSLMNEMSGSSPAHELSTIRTSEDESNYQPENSLANDLLGHAEILKDGSLFVSSSPAMLRIREKIEKIANFNLPVLILGESGSGKEIIARLIHSRSPRAGHSFLKVNCAALPEPLLESELFGYECGAFTGATRSRIGIFEFCNSGTILLDEIGEMPPSLQAKLLHVLQDKTFSRLGAHTTISVDVRIIAATNVNVFEALESGLFREDLYYRLNTFVISVPPLRERQDEIPILLEHFIERFAMNYGCPPMSISRKVVETCINYPWPGNIRELQSFVLRLLIQRDEKQALQDLRAQALMRTAHESGQSEIAKVGPKDLKAWGREIRTIAEREAIARVLLETRYNRRLAAQRLMISYRALYNKIRQYGLQKPSSLESEKQPQLVGNHS
jgi:transcriptional regulator with PAS, ATPase and Fis domain